MNIQTRAVLRANGLEKRALWALALVCLAYLSLVVRYSIGTPLIMDEFASAWSVQQLIESIPYRDYQPYKTLLGSYYLVPVFVLVDDTWWGLITARCFLACTVALFLFVFGRALFRWYRPWTVVCGVIGLILISTFTEHSAAIRVDMLTAIVGMASLLSGLRKNHTRAAFLAAVSFLVSQKGAYYIIALGCVEVARAWSEPLAVARRRLLAMIAAGFAPIALYILLFGLFSSVQQVAETVFLSRRTIALGDHYPEVRTFWNQTLVRNPSFYAWAALGLVGSWIGTAIRNDRQEHSRNISIYATVLLLLCIWHKQPWPYFFVLLLPTASVVAVDFLDRVAQLRYGVAIVFSTLTLGCSIFLALLRVPLVLNRTNEHQRETVLLGEELVSESQSYFAGVPLLRHRNQAPTLKWLDKRQLLLIHKDPATALSELVESPPAAVVLNYRTQACPQEIRDYLKQHYLHLAGNVLVPSISLSPKQTGVHVGFPGLYRTEFMTAGGFTLGGKAYYDGDVMKLNTGDYEVTTTAYIRLRRVPATSLQARLAFKTPSALFDNVYNF